MTSTDHLPATEHVMRAKTAELLFHPIHRHRSREDVVHELAEYGYGIGHGTQVRDAERLVDDGIEAHHYFVRRDHDVRSLAQRMLTAESDARSWLVLQETEAHASGNVIREMTLREVRTTLANLGLISGQ